MAETALPDVMLRPAVGGCYAPTNFSKRSLQFMRTLPDFATLKSKHRALRDGLHENLSLRVHRGLSWLSRSEACGNDDDARFIFLWIAFNALYSEESGETTPNAARDLFEYYFGKIVRLDTERRIYDAIWARFAGPVRVLLENKYVYQPFWSHHNQLPGFADWEDRFASAKYRLSQALARQDTSTILTMLFDRLYVLRNQLVHGGATWNSGMNRAQVRDGAALLAFLIPLFIDLMMDNTDTPWGKAHYPVVE
jgi:hypothetical protein